MKLKTIMVWLCLAAACACNSKDGAKNNKQITNKDMDNAPTAAYFTPKYDPETGVEILDFSLFNEKKTSPMVFSSKEGGTITLCGPYDDGAYYEEFPPFKFYKTQKQFYLNGKLKQESSFYLGNLMVGKTKYYDEEGRLTQEVDEDKKFEKLKVQIDDVLKFMHNKGWLNIETGEGKTEVKVRDGHVEIYQPEFGIQLIEEKDTLYWYASHIENYDVTIVYKINGITGKSEQFEQKIEVVK